MREYQDYLSYQSDAEILKTRISIANASEDISFQSAEVSREDLLNVPVQEDEVKITRMS